MTPSDETHRLLQNLSPCTSHTLLPHRAGDLISPGVDRPAPDSVLEVVSLLHRFLHYSEVFLRGKISICTNHCLECQFTARIRVVRGSLSPRVPAGIGSNERNNRRVKFQTSPVPVATPTREKEWKTNEKSKGAANLLTGY